MAASDLVAWLDGLVALAGQATPGKRDAVLCDGDSGEKWYDIWSPELGSLAQLSEYARSDAGRATWKGDARFIAALDPDTVVTLVNVVKVAHEWMQHVVGPADEHEGGGSIDERRDAVIRNRLRAALRAAEASGR